MTHRQGHRLALAAAAAVGLALAFGTVAAQDGLFSGFENEDETQDPFLAEVEAQADIAIAELDFLTALALGAPLTPFVDDDVAFPILPPIAREPIEDPLLLEAEAQADIAIAELDALTAGLLAQPFFPADPFLGDPFLVEPPATFPLFDDASALFAVSPFAGEVVVVPT